MVPVRLRSTASLAAVPAPFRRHRTRARAPAVSATGPGDDTSGNTADTSIPGTDTSSNVPDTSSSNAGSARTTLSALDDLLGVVPVPGEEDFPPFGSIDEGPAVIKVPLLWMTVPGQQPQRQNNGGVASALSASGGAGDVYAAITVGLPDRATKKQQERGVKGIELDFCLDTACTTNFILPQVAYGLDMQVVGSSPAGVGATGPVGGGEEMLLGAATLGSGGDGGDGVIALSGLSAAVVAVPAPGTAGIMGRSFLNCFGAVAFEWTGGADGETRAGASVSFYQEYDWTDESSGRKTAELLELPCGLLAVEVTLNGVRMPALLDTGAPQTIINRAAAAAAGIIVGGGDGGGGGGGDETKTPKNPLAGFMDVFNKGKERALQDKGVMVMGAGGKPERLDRVDGSAVTLEVTVIGGQGAVPVRCASVLVGELQAFQAGLGCTPPSAEGATDGAPGVVLGLDALMSRPMVVIGTTPGVTKMQL